MNEHIKKFLNEEQDPKAIEKITSKLTDLLMKNEEVGYIGVQKKPVTVFPDSIVLTNKRIIICKPKNLGLSMDFTDYTWDDISGTFVKENILGSEFSFSTKTDLTISIDYIPKIQARKIYTFAKEQLDILKNGVAPVTAETVYEEPKAEVVEQEEIAEEVVALAEEPEVVEEIETEEVTDFAEIIPVSQSGYRDEKQFPDDTPASKERAMKDLSQDELFEKLQNYKKLLDNGLIMQGEYDSLKKEILSYM
ncbi:PH domain-containing protein [Flavobacterium soli]|uniref:PH domain-containing protein n=1 Tax=Flavobacterium soli TaxID=344881 RepID=UPI000415E32B|nr:PH domain-containing protein [Flavobacterium soli]